MSSIGVEEVLTLAEKLSRQEQYEVLERLLVTLKQADLENTQKPKRSLLGVLEEFGPAPSADEIDEVRREMWSIYRER
jgi:thioredoxin-like negative regulator of GroEL